MTSPATIGLQYDGADLQTSDLGLFLEIVAGLDDSPNIRGQDQVIPYLDGQVSRPRRFDSRRILLEGHVMSIGDDEDTALANYRTTRRALAELFDNTRLAADLRVELEDGDIARIECRPTSLIADEVIRSHFARISVELLAVSDWEGLGS